MLDSLILTGEVEDRKKTFQFFATPKELAKRMFELAEVKDHTTLLEPSAGQGAILDQVDRWYDLGVVAIELDPKNCEILREKKYQVFNEDFLKYKPESEDDEYCLGGFETVLMNPPFSRQQDIEHITHAYNYMVEKGGTIVAICSESAFFRENKKSVEFRKLLEDTGAYVEKLEAGTFKESGTMVASRLIKIVKV